VIATSDGKRCTCSEGADCSHPGKHPLWPTNWKEVLCDDVYGLDKLLQEEHQGRLMPPWCNVAMATGIRSNRYQDKYVIVVDVDEI